MDKNIQFLDGGMGTILQNSGIPIPKYPEELNFTHSEDIIKIHRDYLNAGADFIYTNTFGANFYKFMGSTYDVAETIRKAVENARAACNECGKGKIILDIAPIGKLLEPSGTMTFEEAYDIFKEVVLAGEGADIIVFETFSQLYELKAAVLAAKENSEKQVFTTMTFEPGGRTFTGTSISEFAYTMESLGVDALGLNCSLGPDEIFPLVKQLTKLTILPIIVKPNAGLPDRVTGAFKLTPSDFTEQMQKIVDLGGIAYIGGCCGTTPGHISALFSRFKDTKIYSDEAFIKKTDSENFVCTACTSETKTVVIKNRIRQNPKIVGERLNPTGKKRFQQALRDRDFDYILAQALEQIDAGADILDVNAGLPDIDEVEILPIIVKKLQSITDTPLQIDSSNPLAIEAALRVYNGKAIVNSVTCEKDKLKQIIPIINKYGAVLIVLTIDENGIPKTAEKRIEMASEATQILVKGGISPENIVFDCLTLTVSAEQAQVHETLNAIKHLSSRGFGTILGVSNISFGLPDREIINSTFLAMAMYAGLDLAIINPNIKSMADTVRAFRVLNSADLNSAHFIKTRVKTDDNAPKPAKNVSENDLFYTVTHGLMKETSVAVKNLLQREIEPLEIINSQLIPVLDKIGADFESGKIFLPQLLTSANAAGAGFKVIEDFYVNSGKIPEKKGTIVLATVKGDVHDIGKNIAKVLLSNYGYDIIDLGKDVLPETVLKTVTEKNVKLAGLSALMTTTVPAMEETIKLLRQHTDCKIMVGGAVLTKDYALSIGADFFCRDAKAGVDVAKSVLG